MSNFTITKAATAQQGVQLIDATGIVNYRNSLQSAMFEISKSMQNSGVGTYTVIITSGITGDASVAYNFNIEILNGAGVILTDNMAKKYSCGAQGQDNGMGAACGILSRFMLGNNGTYSITITKD